MRNRVIYCELMTDERGWPLIKFDPDFAQYLSPNNEGFRLVGEFLQDDVGLLLALCDELAQGLSSVMEGREAEWVWNGDRFFVLARKDIVEMKDKYGEGGLDAKPFLIDTPLLAALAHGWARFVASIPRQREFSSSKTA